MENVLVFLQGVESHLYSLLKGDEDVFLMLFPPLVKEKEKKRKGKKSIYACMRCFGDEQLLPPL